MNQQLVLTLVTDEPLEKTSVTNSVTDEQMLSLQRFCFRAFTQGVEKSVTPFVEKYTPSGRKKEYYRLSWRESRHKVKHIHIRGGNTQSPLAQYRAKKLQELCDRGAELEEVLAALKTYQGTKPTK